MSKVLSYGVALVAAFAVGLFAQPYLFTLFEPAPPPKRVARPRPHTQLTQPTSRRATTGPVVAIVKGKDIDKMVAQAVELVGGLKIKPGQKVVIKPNLTNYHGTGERLGMTTSIEAVRAVVGEIDRTGVKCKVTFAEGSGQAADDVFSLYGYTQLAGENNINLVDLALDARSPVRLSDGLGEKEYMMPRTILDCDYLIDMPKLKTHDIAGITVGIKNLFGFMAQPRGQFHDRLNETLADIVEMRRPDMVIVDGIVGMEGQGPLAGTDVRMDLIIAGTDVVAVDTVAAAVMGHDPRRFKYLQYCVDKHLGEGDLSRIVIKGEPIEKVRRHFLAPITRFSFLRPRTPELEKKLAAEAASANIVRDVKGRPVRSEFWFRHGTTKPQIDKYPYRENHSFSAKSVDGWQNIEFDAIYETIYPENKLAAIEEIDAWLRAPIPAEALAKYEDDQRKAATQAAAASRAATQPATAPATKPAATKPAASKPAVAPTTRPSTSRPVPTSQAASTTVRPPQTTGTKDD